MPMLKTFPEKKPTYLSEIARIIGIEPSKIQISQDMFDDAGKAEEGCFNIHVDTPELDKRYMASFSLVEMPGCCGILVSTEAMVTSRYRGKGLGTLLNEMRIHIAHIWGYSLLVCTDLQKNTPQQRILRKKRWRKNLTFNNARTKNDVCLHSIKVKKGKYSLGFALEYYEHKE